MLSYARNSSWFFLAKAHQPNAYYDQIDLVDLPEGYDSDTPTIYGPSWRGTNRWYPHGPNYSYNHGLDSNADVQ